MWHSLRVPITIGSLLLASACDGAPIVAAPTGPNLPNNPTPVVTASVSMQNLAFVPSAIQVSPGAVVTFTNLDNTAHNVTFNNGGATNIGDFTTGSRTTTMTTAPGTYTYRCTIHAGMNGTITVQ